MDQHVKITVTAGKHSCYYYMLYRYYLSAIMCKYQTKQKPSEKVEYIVQNQNKHKPGACGFIYLHVTWFTGTEYLPCSSLYIFALPIKWVNKF